MPRRSPRRSRRRSRSISGGVFGQSKTEYYIRALGNMYNPGDELVHGYKSGMILGFREGYYPFSPYLKRCWDLYEHLTGYTYHLYNKYKNRIIPNVGYLGSTNQSAEELINDFYRTMPVERPLWREAKKRFQEGIHQIYSEVMAATAGPQRRSMFGHSYESIVPEQ